VEIVAHRGASRDAPENTVSSMNLGWEQGADACELDIRLTKDGRIVVVHDRTTKRTAGLDRDVSAQTLAELRQLDAGRWKEAKWAGEKIPTLAEALATIPDGKRMFIEIKCGPEVLPELERVLKASGKRPEQLVLIGFDYDLMRLARERFPRLRLFWICSHKIKGTNRTPAIESLIAQAKDARFDGLDLESKFPITIESVSKVRAAGLGVHVWTIDDPELARQWIAAGVDSITTNRPGGLREELGPALSPASRRPLQ